MPTNKKKAPIPLSQVPKPAKWFNWVSVYTIEEDGYGLEIELKTPFLKKHFSLAVFFLIGMSTLCLLMLIDTVRNFGEIEHPYESLFTSIILFIIFIGLSYFILSQQLDTITVKVSPRKIIRSEKPLIRREEEWFSKDVLSIDFKELERVYHIQIIFADETLSTLTLFKVQTEAEADWFCAKLNKILKKKDLKLSR